MRQPRNHWKSSRGICTPTRRRLLPRSALLRCAAALVCVVFFSMYYHYPAYARQFPQQDGAHSSLLFLSPQLSAAQHAVGLGRDYLALKEFYRTTNGGNWTNNTGWDTTYTANQVTRSIIDQFYGVVLYNGLDRVKALRLQNNNLIGTLPDKIGEIDSLMWLRLDQNSISGSIPSSLGNLTRLDNLGLSSNNLTGTLPLKLFDCRKLTFLELKNNAITGSIPADIYKLSELVRLDLRNNRFTGPITSHIGNLTSLVDLELGNCYGGQGEQHCGSNENAFTGTIPSEIGRLTKLEFLKLQSLDLSGPIPSQLGNLTKLKAVNLRDNSLSGPIPSGIGNISSLVTLELGSNMLTGAIPPTLGRLKSLEEMELSENALSGQIPVELSGATVLRILFLENNKLTGKIPPELGTLSSLLELSVAHNKLVGGIPKELGNLSRTMSLKLNDNQLSGEIPSEIGLLKSLILFWIQNNDFKGELPRSLLDIKSDPANGLVGLASFDFRGQPLCAPLDDEFQSWMQLIDARGSLLTDFPTAGAHGPFCLAWSSDDIIDMSYMQNRPIEELVLPGAMEGSGIRPFTFSMRATPPGLTFDAQTRTLSGTPTQAHPRDAYYYSVVDSSGRTKGMDIYIEVMEELRLDSIPDMGFAVGEAISEFTFPSATGGLASDYRYSISPPDAPAGLSFSRTGTGTIILSGTPSEITPPTTYAFTVESARWDASQEFTIEVFEEVSFTQAVADQTYVLEVEVPALQLPAATGGEPPYAYVLEPALPEGLSFDPLPEVRTLSGTPMEVWEKAPTTYRVTDAAGRTDTITFDIEVLEGLGLAAIADQHYTIGEAIPALILPEASGGRGPYAYALSPELPAGLTYDAAARRLSGTPTAVMGPTPYMFTTTDAGQRTAQRTFEVVVAAPEALIRDRAALIALYEASDGANWTNNTNWLNPPADVVAFTPQELDAWFGITMSEVGRVARVELSDNNLQGGLPEEVGNLSALEQLRLYGNALGGTIPSSLGRLATLQGLLLHDNGLTGAIPSSLGDLTALKQLHLHNNRLTGPLPGSLGDLSALEQLWLYGNALEGAIPAALGQLARLRGLLLHDNGLTGPIPPSLGQLSLLEDLWLHGNALEGAIPAALGQLARLRGLLLHDNGLTGPIPSSLGQLSLLEDLWLHGNALEGAIPSSLGQLGKVRDLWLHGNALEGPIPSSLGQLDSLRMLLLHDNRLTGALPSSLGQLARLEWLHVSGNALTGRLPDSLGALGSLEYLYLHDNALTGRLPGTLIRLTALKELFFGGQVLCAPIDERFQAWLASRETVKGFDCAGATLSFAVPVSDQHFTMNVGIEDLVLPLAGGGSTTVSIHLAPGSADRPEVRRSHPDGVWRTPRYGILCGVYLHGRRWYGKQGPHDVYDFRGAGNAPVAAALRQLSESFPRNHPGGNELGPRRQSRRGGVRFAGPSRIGAVATARRGGCASTSDDCGDDSGTGRVSVPDRGGYRPGNAGSYRADDGRPVTSY